MRRVYIGEFGSLAVWTGENGDQPPFVVLTRGYDTLFLSESTFPPWIRQKPSKSLFTHFSTQYIVVSTKWIVVSTRKGTYVNGQHRENLPRTTTVMIQGDWIGSYALHNDGELFYNLKTGDVRHIVGETPCLPRMYYGRGKWYGLRRVNNDETAISYAFFIQDRDVILSVTEIDPFDELIFRYIKPNLSDPVEERVVYGEVSSEDESDVGEDDEDAN